MKKPNSFKTYEKILFDGSFDKWPLRKKNEYECKIVEVGLINRHFSDKTKTMRPLCSIDYLSYLGFKQTMPKWVKEIGYPSYYFIIHDQIMFYPFPREEVEVYLINEYTKKI